jgi:hypothetical protein
VDLPEIITVKDIKKHLHIGHDRAYQLINLKGFPAMKLGKRYIIQKDKYLKWLEENYKNKIIF